jgi:hypothetical protein
MNIGIISSLGAVMNNFAVNICASISVWIYVFSNLIYNPKSDIAAGSSQGTLYLGF